MNEHKKSVGYFSGVKVSEKLYLVLKAKYDSFICVISCDALRRFFLNSYTQINTIYTSDLSVILFLCDV